MRSSGLDWKKNGSPVVRLGNWRVIRLQISARLPRLSRETETTAYRLVQECYHNIAKHSEAATVNISLRSTDELLRLA